MQIWMLRGCSYRLLTRTSLSPCLTLCNAHTGHQVRSSSSTLVVAKLELMVNDSTNLCCLHGSAWNQFTYLKREERRTRSVHAFLRQNI